MANLTKEDIRSVIETIKELYLEDMIPWICGYSGGKDSSAVVQLVWYALMELPKEKLKKTVHVISTDTLVESPVVAIWASQSLKKMEKAAKEHQLPIIPHRLTPALTNTFWVNLIGRGYPYPRRDFRWCTDRMKIDTSNRFIKSVLDAESEAIMVLGSRKAESAVRKAVLEGYEKKRYRDHLSPNGSFPNSYVFTPIENWENDNAKYASIISQFSIPISDKLTASSVDGICEKLASLKALINILKNSSILNFSGLIIK